MADKSIRVEYNQDLEPLEKLLSTVKRAGDFFVSGAVEIPLPKMEVDGVGLLSFPVLPAQIAALIGQATRAPYGRGEATILDESVRKVWQLPPFQVRLGGKSWALNFDGILKQVIAGLGCGGMAVSADLYKVLVYDEGGFFRAHRDTEKADGMFGTLVVVLPSTHSGGELVIRHAGREVVVDMSGAEPSELSFAAFYADCEHEVRPITAGNRVCLVYNLIHERNTADKKGSLAAPDYEPQMAAAANLLETTLSAEGAPAKVAWLLEHQYSPDGLAFAALKSADAARVKVLAQAAERAGCVAHLGIVHIEESGAAEHAYHDHHSRGRGWYHHDDEEENEGEEGADFEVVEVFDSRHYVSQWRDLRDRPVDFGEIPVEPGELLPVGALEDEKPDEQRLMEASGNEGASFERSYHRAALVIWRRERYAEVLLQAGVAAVLPYLNECITAAGAATAPPSARKDAVTLARTLVRAWADSPAHSGFGQPGTPGKRDVMLRLLHQLGDPALLMEFVAEVVARDYDGSDNVALVTSTTLLDAKTTGRLFSELIRRHLCKWPWHCVDLLHALASEAALGAQSEYGDALRQIAGAVVSQLDKVKKEPAGENEWMDEELEELEELKEDLDQELNEQARTVDADLVTKILDVLGALNVPELHSEAVQKFTAHPEVFDPVTVLTPALARLREWDAGLWEHSVDFLLRRSGRPPVAPKDWRQEVKLSCACADCRELQAFTLDPVNQTHRFRVRMDRRQHLHQQIERHHLDMTHVTERQGSPQTLVCTKDRRSYTRQCDQYRKDIAALAALAKQARKTPAKSAGPLDRIAAARALAAEWSPE